jgi:intracellular sulfur oxidation DsrE/DsrF family protein
MGAAACVLAAAPALAGPDDLRAGPVIRQFGPAAEFPDPRVGPDTEFKVAFDIGDGAAEGALNMGFVTVARFLNMHARAGVPEENMSLAIVVHGSAAYDLLTEEARGGENPNAPLIAALADAGVSIELCGQTAVYRDIAVEDLLPGVSTSLSAMTAHARLQQNGYTLNPF